MTKPAPRLLATLCFLFLVLFLVSPVLQAQNATTSPSGWDNREAPGISTLLGSLPDSRFQFLDGEVNSLAAKITQVDVRLDRDHAFDQPARSWSNVLLFMGPCDVKRHSTFLDNNPTAARQLVFVSNVSWPAVKNSTLGTPAPFGGSNGEYKFPLRAPFAKSTAQDLLLDFVFAQGALANSAPWTVQDIYPLDGFDESESSREYSVQLGSQMCVEVGQSRAAICEAGMYTYRKQAATTQRADKVVAWLSTFFAPSSTSVIQAMGTIMNPSMPVGACQHLHLRLQPQAFIHGQTDAAGTLSVYLGAVPYQPALAGVRIAAQAAYNSPATRRLELTLATDSPIAAQQVAYSVNRISYWTTSSSATQGYYADHRSSPLFRYTYQ